MRILHVITGLETGGAEASLYKLIRHSTEVGADHVVCSLNGPGSFGPKLSELGIPVHALNGRLGSLLLKLPSFVQRVEPQLIHGWMYHGNLAATFVSLSAATRAPVLWNIRQCLLDLRNEKRGTAIAIRIGAILSKRPQGIVYNSHLAAHQHEAVGFSAENRHVIDNGFDTDVFKPNSRARSQFRAQIEVSDDVPLVGCIARFHPMKDHTNFLRAADRVRVHSPKAIFVLVGKNTDAVQITNIVRELGLSDNMRILGERSDISTIMAALDLLVLPSWSEAFPNVIGEAMACGIPCIATDVGESRRIVGATGSIVPPRDFEALAQAILTLFQRSDRVALGCQARERIVAEFSLAAMTRSYKRLYTQILATPNVGRRPTSQSSEVEP